MMGTFTNTIKHRQSF